MKLIFVILSVISLPALGQNFISGNVTAATNSVNVVGGNTQISATGNVNLNASTLHVKGNFTNAGNINGTNATMVYSGLSAQQSNGVYNILNLRVDNNSAAVTAGNAPSNKINILGTLSFGPVNNANLNTGTGGVVLISNAQTTARIADQTNGGSNTNNTITGTVTVERYISDLTTRRWHLLNPPVTGQTIFNSWQEGGLTGAEYTNYGTYVTNGVSAANGFDVLPHDAVAPAASIRAISAAGGFSTPANTTTVKPEDAAAWFLFIRSGRPSASYNSALTGPTVLRNTGNIRQNGTFGDAVAAGAGCAPARNPFSSPVNLLTATIPGNKIYVWDPGYGGTLGGYRLYDKSYDGINYRTFSSGGAFPSVMNNLQSGQAFYVPQSATPGSTAFKETDKTTSNNNILRLTNNSNINSSIIIRAKSMDTQGNYTERDVTAALFNDNYDNGLVYGEDIQKPGNFNENLSLFRGGQWIAIEKRMQPQANDTLFIQFWKTNTQPYRFEIEAEGLESNVQAFLVDNYLQTQTPINTAGISIYDFASNGANNDLNRFNIVFKPAAILPVSITNIKAYKHNNGANISWTVNNETAIASYDIEKSANGTSFTKLATVPATNNAATNTYTGFDANLVNGTNYYRVKSIGINGDVKHTAVVSIVNGKDEAITVNIYPNPVKGGAVNVNLTNLPKGRYSLTIFSNDGKQLAVKNISIHNTASISEVINLPAGTAKGVYQLKVINATEKNTNAIATQQILVD